MNEPKEDGTVGRRGFLALTASGVAALFTGCADPQAVLVLVLDEATDDGIADTAEEIERGSDEADVIPDAVEDGNQIYVGTGRVPPMEFSSSLLFNGTYYDAGMRSEPVSKDVEYVLRVEYAVDEPAENETEFDALPEADRDALSGLLSPEEPEGFEGETGRLYTEEERNASVLIEDGAHTVVEGGRYTVEAERGETVPNREYIYRFEEVADSRDEYVSWVRDGFTFTHLTTCPTKNAQSWRRLQTEDTTRAALTTPSHLSSNGSATTALYGRTNGAASGSSSTTAPSTSPK